MAADRAAELTEAYRILSDEGRRGEYDRARNGAASPAAAAAEPPPPSAAVEPDVATKPVAEAQHTASPPPPTAPPESTIGAQFRTERASRDEFVRKATVSRVRTVIDAVLEGYDQVDLPGFDLAWTPKSRMFGRARGPRLFCRFVSRVDRDAVADVWSQAAKTVKGDEEVCVLLIGSEIAPAGELATAIGDQRKRQRAMKLSLIPVDARAWDARMPLDAPAIAKTLLARLKSGQ
jgi:hypothetical protein